jgi:hypothetical protein
MLLGARAGDRVWGGHLKNPSNVTALRCREYFCSKCISTYESTWRHNPEEYRHLHSREDRKYLEVLNSLWGRMRMSEDASAVAVKLLD